MINLSCALGSIIGILILVGLIYFYCRYSRLKRRRSNQPLINQQPNVQFSSNQGYISTIENTGSSNSGFTEIELRPLGLKTELEQYWCKVCKIPINSKPEFNEHIRQKHNHMFNKLKTFF